MPTLIEPVNRGLTTALDPAFMPQGGLVLAQNARYRPGEQGIFQAEGRLRCGSGGQGEGRPITQLAGLRWDDAPPRILYRLANGGVREVAAASNPTSLAFDLPRTPTAPGVLLGDSPWEVIAVNSQHVLLTGGPPLWLEVGNPTAVRPLGVAQPGSTGQGSGLVTSATFVSQAPGGLLPGGYWYWATWNKNTTGLQGSGISGTALATDAKSANATGAVGVNNVDVVITTPAAIPTGVTSIILWRNADPVTVTSVYGTTTIPQAWPFGIGIGYITNLLPNTTYTVRDTGSAPASPLNAFPAASRPEFPYVVVSVDGLRAFDGKYGRPPLRSTAGDVFEDSLCLNDLDNPRKMVFSYPSEHEAFPGVFFITFNTRHRDKITAIRSLGRSLGVFLERSVWRVNWLPAQSDFDFARGSVSDLVVEEFGAFSPQGVTRFHLPGRGPLLAWIGELGVYATDLFEWFNLTDQVDWKALDIKVRNPVGAVPTHTATLLNNPNEYRLELYDRDRAYYLHYHQSHLVDGRPAFTGPILRPERIAAAVSVIREDGVVQSVTTDTGAQGADSLYYEGFGLGGTAPTDVIAVGTREIYPAGLGQEVKMKALLVHARAQGTIPGSSAGGYSALAIVGPPDVAKPLALPEVGRDLVVRSMVTRGERVSFLMGGTGSGVGVNAFGIEYESLEGTERRAST